MATIVSHIGSLSIISMPSNAGPIALHAVLISSNMDFTPINLLG